MAAAPPPPPRSSAASGGRGCHVAAAVRHEAVGSHCVASAEASMRRRQPLLTALTALTPLFDFVLERVGPAWFRLTIPSHTRQSCQSCQFLSFTPSFSLLFFHCYYIKLNIKLLLL